MPRSIYYLLLVYTSAKLGIHAINHKNKANLVNYFSMKFLGIYTLSFVKKYQFSVYFFFIVHKTVLKK